MKKLLFMLAAAAATAWVSVIPANALTLTLAQVEAFGQLSPPNNFPTGPYTTIDPILNGVVPITTHFANNVGSGVQSVNVGKGGLSIAFGANDILSGVFLVNTDENDWTFSFTAVTDQGTFNTGDVTLAPDVGTAVLNLSLGPTAGTISSLFLTVSGNVPAPGGTGTDFQAEYHIGATPLPGALPLFASGLGALGLFGWRKRRKAKLAA